MDIIDIALARKNAGSGSSITSVGTDQIQDGAVTLEKLDSNIVEQISSNGGADWNAVDGESGFIANRPFGITGYDTLYEGEVTIAAPDMSHGNPGGADIGSIDIELGMTYTVEFDGETYSVECKESNGNLYIGNLAAFIFWSPSVDTGEPFLYMKDTGLFAKEGYTSRPLTIKISGAASFSKIGPYSAYFEGHLVTNGTGKNSDVFNSTENVASDMWSHAEGKGTTASGQKSHAEGYDTTASGTDSHAEGSSTIASSESSHAEGQSTTASNDYSHAEGNGTTASGACSHAEGNNTTASGQKSHAEGYGTIAASQNQHAGGRYNIEDTANKYAEIIGNGDYSKRSNARTLDWNGNEWLAGGVTVSSTGGITIGSTTINETQLQALLALLNS